MLVRLVSLICDLEFVTVVVVVALLICYFPYVSSLLSPKNVCIYLKELPQVPNNIQLMELRPSNPSDGKSYYPTP